MRYVPELPTDQSLHDWELAQGIEGEWRVLP
jgi:hypothetical protein